MERRLLRDIVLKSTVLLCSDAPILGEGLAALLAQAGDFDLISCCPKTDDLSDQLAYHQPNVLLIDRSTVFTFDQFSGLKELGERTKIVLWVHSISTEMASQAMSLGVRGILRKVGPIEALLRCLVRVKEGGLWFENGLAGSMRSARRYSLTRREGQLVALLTQGLKNKEIATALRISEGTVKVYLSRLFQKLKMKGRFELAVYGFKNLAESGSTDVTTAGIRQPNISSIVNPPRSFFVESLHGPGQLFSAGVLDERKTAQCSL